MTTPTLPSASHVAGDTSHVPDHDLLAAAAALAVYGSNNGTDFGDAGSTRANLHVPALTPAACVVVTNVASRAGLNTYDGYTLAAGDLVLLTAQTTASQNGLWAATSSTWTRPTEFAAGLVVLGCTCRVLNGTVYANTDWTLIAPTAGVTVDTTAQTWSRLAVGGAATANNLSDLANVATARGNLGVVNNPGDFAALGWTTDPANTSATIQLAVSGRLYLVRFRCAVGGAVGHVLYYLVTAGATLTSGQSLIGIYDTGQTTGATATLLCQTADQSTNFASGAGQVGGAANAAVAFTSTPTLTVGQDYFFAVLSVGTTMPKFIGNGTVPAFANFGLAGLALRTARDANTGLTGLPSTISAANVVADTAAFTIGFTAAT